MGFIVEKITEPGLSGGSKKVMQRNGTLLPYDTGTGRGAASMFSKGLMSDCMTGCIGYGSGSDMAGEATWGREGYGTGGKRNCHGLLWNTKDAEPRVSGCGGCRDSSLGSWL